MLAQCNSALRLMQDSPGRLGRAITKEFRNFSIMCLLSRSFVLLYHSKRVLKTMKLKGAIINFSRVDNRGQYLIKCLTSPYVLGDLAFV